MEKLAQKNNKLVAKIVFVARCDIHLEICTKILSLKWSIFGLITVGNNRTLFLCYAAVTPTTAFLILHVAEMWKRGNNNLIQVALVFIPFS